MIYCEQCGAANDIMNEQCYRCGHSFAAAEGPLVPAAAPSPESVIGQELQLPDWLKRAAAETPAAPSDPSTARQLPPPAFRVAGANAPLTTDDLFRAEPPPSPPPAARQLPPVPTAGLPNTMPDWLKTQAVPQPSALDSDASDTSTFISENDLPDWIRQIAEADAAKQAEAERFAAEASRNTEAAAPKRVVLPGESTPSAPSANPWLTRRDGVPAAKSWGTPEPPAAPAPANVAEPAPVRTGVAAPDYGSDPAPIPTKKVLKVNVPSVSMPKFSRPALNRGANAESSPVNIRTMLIAAVVILLVILVIAMVL